MAAEPGSVLTLDAARARRLLLVQAVDEADTQGRLVGAAERDQIERAALHAVAGPDPRQQPDAARYLDERARRLLELVEKRDARTAALQRAEPWQRWMAWGLPLLALVLGLVLERIDNPHQVNLLSPPLLAFLAWNLAVYLAVLLRPLWARRGMGSPGGLASALRDWLGQRQPPRRERAWRAAVAMRFRLHWWRVAGALEGWRIEQMLHAAAAAWAVGVGLSIVLGGLVREYRVGWESTLLDLPQVHALLSVLFAPVVALLPVEGFTQADLARMHFGSGAPVGQAEARHWIVLYLGLLALFVVLPRLVLALHASLRRHWLARAIRVPLDDAYFSALLARVSPARVVLLWGAADPETRERLRELWLEASVDPGMDLGERFSPLRTDRGDELSVREFTAPIAAAAAPSPAPQPALEEAANAGARNGAPSSSSRWLARLQAWWQPAPVTPASTQAAADLWLLALRAPEQLGTIVPQLQALPVPVLLLNAGSAQDGQALRGAAAAAGLTFELLDLQAVVGCWAWETPLREALLRQLPSQHQAGVQRLMIAWLNRHEERLRAACALLAEPLQQALREAQAVGAGPLSLRQLVSASEREAGQHALQEAMASLLARVGERQLQAWTQLRRLYGLPPAPAWEAQERGDLQDRFQVRQGVHAPQAGMAGAASGAAAGASIDLMTGGLTLGAAAAIGAVLGGGAAFVAAALRNRATPGGTQVQLSDEMLQALCEMALLQYLAVSLRGQEPPAGEVPAGWRSEAVALVEDRRAALKALWERGRKPAPDDRLAADLNTQLEAMARELLARLHPAPRA